MRNPGPILLEIETEKKKSVRGEEGEEKERMDGPHRRASTTHHPTRRRSVRVGVDDLVDNVLGFVVS